MRVLIACEFSGRVRDAFIEHGHDAVSCDLLESERPGPHVVGDVLDIIGDGWDLMVAHPPCTYLCNSGVRWLGGDKCRWDSMTAAAEFFRVLLDAPIPRVCVENPVMHKYAREIVGRRASQFIQPWQFGDNESKRTGLWLRGLPELRPVVHSEPLHVCHSVHMASPGPDRWRERSRTFKGIAEAMANQWGGK